MYRHLQISIIILFCACFSSHAKSLNLLSLSDAFDLAKANNPEFKAKLSEIEIKKANVKTAKARPNPSIISDNGIAESTYRAGISYTLELGGKRHKRAAVSQSQLETSKKNIDIEWLNFRGQIREAYTKLYYAQEQLLILKQVLESSEKLLEISQKREEAGDIPTVSVLQAEVSNIDTQNKLEKAKYKKHEARHHLEYLLNTKFDDAIQLNSPNEFPVSDPSKLVQNALEHRPELKAGELKKELAQNELRLAKSKRIPDLSLAAGPDFVTGSDGSISAFVTAQMEIPIFNFQGAAIDAIKARQEQLSLEQEAIKNKIKTEVEHAYLSYVFYKESLDRYENKLIPKVKDIAEKSLLSFELGKSPVWVPVNAQISYMNTQLNHIQALMNYQKSIGMLERAIGVGL